MEHSDDQHRGEKRKKVANFSFFWVKNDVLSPFKVL